MSLTELTIKAAKGKDKTYKLYDDRGLFLLLVTPTDARKECLTALRNVREDARGTPLFITASSKTVQLDLEAKGVIEREHVRPLRLHRVQPGDPAP